MTSADTPSADLLLSVVVPVYNERETLAEVVDRVMAVPVRKEVILVDDGSRDGSADLVRELGRRDGVRAFHHEHNQGKGAALRTGFQQVSGDVVVIQDADLEYDPDDYPKLLEPIRCGRADVVYGSRFLVDEDEPGRKRDELLHYLGNRFLTFASNLFTGLNLTDMETCYKCMRADIVSELTIRSRGFTVEPELTARLARMPVRIHEVPIRYAGRNYDQGKKITWRDGVEALWAIVRYRFAG